MINIYLADPTHDGTGKFATDVMPYNIGLIAAYAKKIFDLDISIRLFKYPEKLFRAIKENPPDILGCSNYCWNANQSEWACEFAKEVNPRVLTVKGGTNYPFDRKTQKTFLQRMPSTDFHIFYEGEIAFVNLLRAYQSCSDIQQLRQMPIAGVQSISPSTGEIVAGFEEPRIKSLDEIPSPYLTGILDEFFDGNLTPILESTRGCPFTCNFCNAADSYFNKVNMFSIERIREEIAYIAPKMEPLGIYNMIFADNNFGMFARDAEISRLLVAAYKRYHWPVSIYLTTGKNNKNRILETTRILGSMTTVNMSVQSMDSQVLKNIKRDNISLETYREVNKQLAREGRNGIGEVIVPLPGETYETYMKGLRDLIDSQVQVVLSYTLLAIHGTPYKDSSDFVEKWGYRMKWRVIPNQFGTYAGRKIFDFEQVAIESNALSFSDYLTIRDFAFVTELAYNTNIFGELAKYLREHGLSVFQWLQRIHFKLDQAPPEIQTVFRSFRAATQEELWDNETELIQHYSQPENYQKLKNGESGFNVVFTHKAWVLSEYTDLWIDFLVSCAREMLMEALIVDMGLATLEEDLAAISLHMRSRLSGVLNSHSDTSDIVITTPYSIRNWMLDPDSNLERYRSSVGYRIRYYFEPIQLADRIEASRRYGDTFIGKAKIIAHRGLANLYRRIQVDDMPDPSQVQFLRNSIAAVRNP